MIKEFIEKCKKKKDERRKVKENRKIVKEGTVTKVRYKSVPDMGCAYWYLYTLIWVQCDDGTTRFYRFSGDYDVVKGDRVKGDVEDIEFTERVERPIRKDAIFAENSEMIIQMTDYAKWRNKTYEELVDEIYSQMPSLKKVNGNKELDAIRYFPEWEENQI